MLVDAAEGYRLWSGEYDQMPNPLPALEMRMLADALTAQAFAGRRVLDAGSGTGRWIEWAQGRGARVVGIDLSHEMLLAAAQKPGLAGRAAQGDICRIPMCDGAVDVTICSLTLGYVESIGAAMKEFARVTSDCLIVSDVHPEAIRNGWTRSFRSGNHVYELRHTPYSVAELDRAAAEAGLVRTWRREGSFDEPERTIFRRAGKEDTFDGVRRIPAILATAWTKS